MKNSLPACNQELHNKHSVYSYAHHNNSGQAIHLAAGTDMDILDHNLQWTQSLSGKALTLHATDREFIPVSSITFLYFFWGGGN